MSGRRRLDFRRRVRSSSFSLLFRRASAFRAVSRRSMLWRNAIRDSTLSRVFLIPKGPWKLAPGRGAIATTTRGMESRLYSTPERVAEAADIRGDYGRSCTPSGVRMLWNTNPGVVVAAAPRPPATICNPYRDKDLLTGVRPGFQASEPPALPSAPHSHPFPSILPPGIRSTRCHQRAYAHGAHS